MKDLFGYTPPVLPRLLLEEPPREQWIAMATHLESTNNKQQLLSYAEAFTPWLNKYGEKLKARPGQNTQQAYELIYMTKSTTTKSEIALGIALILASPKNLQSYVDALSDGMKTLWRKVLIKNYVSQASAKKYLATTKNLFEEQQSYYYYSSGAITWNIREMGWFQTSTNLSEEMSKYSSYHVRKSFITISGTLRGIFFPYFFPELAGSNLGMDTLPDGEQWRIVEFEASSIAHFKLLSSLIQQDELPIRKKGIGITDMKRALKKLALEEIYPENTNDYRKHLRAYNYIQLLALNDDKRNIRKKQPSTYPDILRELFDNFENMKSFLPNIFYPHIKGLRQSTMQWGKQDRLCLLLFNMFKEVPQQWISINDVIMRITELESNGNNSYLTTMVFHPSDEKYINELTNEYANHFITVERYVDDFGYTGLQACALMLCSLGMAEVAINEGATRQLSPFDQVEYVRLTPLGCYAFGITNEYDAPEEEPVAYFELDPDRLIIRSLTDPNPYAQLLTDTSVPISKNRFETSAQSFLANCHSREDVESKIKIFRQFIANSLPPLWEQFFKQLLMHCHPLKEDKTSYRRYTLDPENRDLIQLITTDPVLRQLVIRAEGYRIMVKTENLMKFEAQLKKHGYLL